MKFWECNIKQDYKEFDFIKAFESFESLIYQKVAEHGFLTYEDYAQTQDEVYNYDSLEEFEATTDYIQITKEDLKLILYEYNLYIQNANEKDLYKKGWKPVCISEFYDNELRIILDDRLNKQED